VSTVELLNYLKKSLGIIIKKIEEEGVLASPSFRDHAFLPEIRVTDRGVAVDVRGGAVLKLKNLSNHPCFFNLDRPVSLEEHGVVPPMSCFVVARRADRVYLKAPMGQECTIKVDALVV